jgi:hypothetical protein
MDRPKTPPFSPVALSEGVKDEGRGLVGPGDGVVGVSLPRGHEHLIDALATEVSGGAPSPLAALPEDVKVRLLESVDSANECSSIFLKETHEQWVDELIVAVEGGDVEVIQSMLDARLALANEALGALLAGPHIPLDLDDLDALFGDGTEPTPDAK